MYKAIGVCLLFIQKFYSFLIIFRLKIFKIEILNKEFATAVSKKILLEFSVFQRNISAEFLAE